MVFDDSPEAFIDLQRQAADLGIEYKGIDAAELNALILIEKARKRQHIPVACFGKSFEAVDPRCRICRLNEECSESDPRPRVELSRPVLSRIPCEVCSGGVLDQEDLDYDGELRDYTCSTRGCPNRASIQCGWEYSEPTEDPIVPMLVPESMNIKAEPKKEAKKFRIVVGGKSTAEEKPKAKRGRPKKVSTLEKPKRGRPKKDPADPPKKRGRPRKVTDPVAESAPKAKRGRPEKSGSAKSAKSAPIRVFYWFEGAPYLELAAIVRAATGAEDMASDEFFGISGTPRPGTVLSRKWNGQKISVLVKELK